MQDRIENLSDASTTIQTDVGSKDGQVKCPKCGSTEISTNTNNGFLRCDFCRHEFEPEKVEGMIEDVSKLEGQVVGSGAGILQSKAHYIQRETTRRL